jgi:hypothetical protein
MGYGEEEQKMLCVAEQKKKKKKDMSTCFDHLAPLSLRP